MIFYQNSSAETIISFQGRISSNKISAIIEQSEIKIHKSVQNKRLEKNILSVVIEILQNLYHHTEIKSNIPAEFKKVEFFIKHTNTIYYIISGNYISPDEVFQLKSWIDNINSLSKNKLKDLYKETLSKTNTSKKSGFKLGFIDVILRSNNMLEYKFVEGTNDYIYFMLGVKVCTTAS